MQQPYLEGVLTRKVDSLLQGMGMTSIDQSAVSRTCKVLDEVVHEF